MTVFSGYRINALRHAAVNSRFGAGCSYRPFARPQRMPLAKHPLRGHRSRPFTSLPDSPLLLPVRPLGSAARTGSPRFGLTSMLLARCSFPRYARRTAVSASTPLKDCYIPPDQSVCRLWQSCGPPSEPARSPFAPRNRVAISSVSAADQRSRSATFSEACCSSNLLEPLSICLRTPQPSTYFVEQKRLFLKMFLLCFVSVTAQRQ